MSTLQFTPTPTKCHSIIFKKSSPSPQAGLDFEFNRTTELTTNLFEELPSHSPFPVIPRRLTWSRAFASTPFGKSSTETYNALSPGFHFGSILSTSTSQNDLDSNDNDYFTKETEDDIKSIEILDLKNEVENLKRENRKLNEKTRNVQKQLDEAEDENGLLNHRIKVLETQLRRLREQGDEEKSNLKKDRIQADENMEKARIKITELRDLLARAEKKNSELTKAKLELECEFDKVNAEVSRLTRDLQKSQHSYHVSEERGVQMMARIEELNLELETLNGLKEKLHKENLELQEMQVLEKTRRKIIEEFEIEEVNDVELEIEYPSILQEFSELFPLTKTTAIQTESLNESGYEFLEVNPLEETNNNNLNETPKQLNTSDKTGNSFYKLFEEADGSSAGDSSGIESILSPFIHNSSSKKTKCRKWSLSYGITYLVLFLIQIFGALYMHIELDSSPTSFLLSHSNSDYGFGQENSRTSHDSSIVRLVKYISKHGELTHELPPRF